MDGQKQTYATCGTNQISTHQHNQRINSNAILKVEYQGKVGKQVSHTKLLVVQMYSNLNWTAQHDSVCKKVSNIIGILKGICNLVPLDVARHFIMH